MKAYIYYHGDADGCFAGWATRRHCMQTYPEAEIIMIESQYDRTLPVYDFKQGDKIFFVDFSAPRSVLQSMWSKTAGVLVLDHHKSAEEELKGLPYAKFDMSKSGALMTWDEFNKDVPAPYSCLLVNDRDLWQWKYSDHTKAFAAYCRVKGCMRDWSFWEKTLDDEFTQKCIGQGMLYIEYEQASIDSFLSHPNNWKVGSYDFDGKSYSVAIFTTSNSLISEQSAALYKKLDVDFVIGWRYSGDGISFSLRSDNRAPCDKIAGQFGGGGHPSSSGFRINGDHGFLFLDRLYQKSIYNNKG